MVNREQILNRIRPFYESRLIKVLIGLRRSGKSVLLRQIMEELTANGVEESQIIYLNFEDFQYAFIMDAGQLYQYVCDQRKTNRSIISFLMKSRW